MNVRLVSDEVAELGEGPRLDPGTGEVLAGQPAAGRVLAIDAGATGPAATPYRPHPGVLP